jgi:hypothetical protein
VGPSRPPSDPPPGRSAQGDLRSADAPIEVSDAAGPPSPPYPVQFEVSYPDRLNRWLPLVKWLLAFPHYVALVFVAIAAFFVAIYAFFAVLFTGRWPRGAFDYLVGTARWFARVVAYTHLMTDAYPPFSLADDADYPVRLDVAYPEHIENWRPLVQWLLAIPYLFVAGVLYSLTGALTIIAFFTVLFTERIPREIFELMLPGLRWNVRGNAYAYFMTEQYPPFVWG